VLLVVIAGESKLSFSKGLRWAALEAAVASAAGVESGMVQIVAVHSVAGGSDQSAGGAVGAFPFAASQGVRVKLELALKDSGSAERVRGRAATPGFKTLLAAEAIQQGYQSSTHTGTGLKVGHLCYFAASSS
jgi:hypothetical protein